LSVTIYDIAKEAGVSIATVSRVFNQSAGVSDDTRQKVLDVAQKMGYHPQAFAQGLARKQKNTVMAVVPVISNYFFMEVLAGIQDKLSQSNFELYIFNVTADEQLFEQVEHVLKRQWAEGYLFISIHLQSDQWKKLTSIRNPIVLVDEYYSNFDSVSVNSVEGAYAATQHLIDRGYERLAMISALETSKPIQDRIAGFKQALTENKMKIYRSLVVQGDTSYRDGFTERAGYEAMLKLIDKNPRPDACFCASDIQAVGALKAMRDRGIYIPIISYDDIEIAEYMGLSTIRQPMYDMGALATQKMIDRLDNPDKQISHTVFSPELVVRASSNGSHRGQSLYGEAVKENSE